MSDVKISALSNAAALDGTELVPVVQGGITVKTTAQDIADLAAGGVTSVNSYTGAVLLKVGDDTVPTAGDSNCLLYANSGGFADTLPVWGINSSDGFQFSKTLNPNNLTGNTLNNYYLGFVPLQNSPDENWNASNWYYDVDPTSTGFTFGTNGSAIQHMGASVNHGGTSNFGYVTYYTNSFTIGNGTDPFDWRGMGFMFGFGQIADNVTLVGPMQGYGFQWNMASGATCSPTNTYASGFYDFCNISCAWDAPWNSFQSGPSIAEVTNNHNFNSFTSNPTINLLSGNAGYFGLVLSPKIDAYTGTAQLSPININPQTSSVHSAQGIYVSLDQVTTFAGTAATLVEQDLTFTVNAPTAGGNSITLEYTPGGTAGSEVVSNVGPAFSVQIDSGVSTATQIKAALDAYAPFTTNASTSISGVGSNPQTTFGPTNFSGGQDPGYKKAAYLDGDVEITGSLTFGGALAIGKLNAFYSQTLVNGTGSPATIHGLISSMTAGNSVTVTNADTIGVNTAALITVGSGSTVSSSFLGLAALALPAVVQIGAGSSVDRIAAAAYALSLDAGAGAGSSIGTLDLCRSIVIPNGITSVTNMRGFTMDLPFGDPGVTTHGVYISPTSAHNYMARNLVIGTSDTPTNANCGFELIATDRAVRLSVLTTAQRNAMTPLKGMIILNDDTNVLEYYDGSAWV